MAKPARDLAPSVLLDDEGAVQQIPSGEKA